MHRSIWEYELNCNKTQTQPFPVVKQPIKNKLHAAFIGKTSVDAKISAGIWSCTKFR